MHQSGRNAILWFVALMGAATATIVFSSCRRPTDRVDVVETAASDGPSAPAEPLAPEKTLDPPVRRLYRSPLAGSWYEADKDALSRQIETFLDQAPAERLAEVCALVLPHAGYRWSGQTAGVGVKQLTGREYRRVIVIGPSHRLPMKNVASVPSVTHYATPLGEIPLDWRFLRQLKQHSVFISNPRAHDGEHSVQIELPFLQRVLGQFRLVPIVVGQLDVKTTRNIAAILRGLIDNRTLVVASSDFTHYGSNFNYFPFRHDVADNLKKLDMGAVEPIEGKDLDGFFRYVEETGATICGQHSIGVLLAMLAEGSTARLLHYDTSGRMTGDYSSSVSYVTIAFSGQWPQGKQVPAESDSSSLSDEDKERLLKLARAALVYAVKNRRYPAPRELGIEVTPNMEAISGAFVTLHMDGKLRGCIGEIYPARPLVEAVTVQAVNAGLKDRRFLPVAMSDIPKLEFEISALTPPQPVKSYAEIVIGKHGVILEKNGRLAVFLPHVAAGQGWDFEETLTQLALKAGLSAEAWSSGASFTVFEAIVFGEGQE